MTNLAESSNNEIKNSINNSEGGMTGTRVVSATFKQIIIKPGALNLATAGWRDNVEIRDSPLKWEITNPDGTVETEKVDWLGAIVAEHLKRHPDHHVLDFPTIFEDVHRVYQMCYTDDYKTQEAKESETQDSERNHLAEYL